MERKAFMDALLTRAQGAGFEAAECYLSSGDSFEASVHEGEIQAYDVSTSIGLGFRGLLNGKMGYAATQALDEAAIDQLIEGAKTNARLIDSEDEQFIYEGSGHYPELDAFEPALEAVGAAEKLSAVLALEQTARSIDPLVKQIDGAMLFSSRSLVHIVNTRGLNVRFEENGAGLYIAPIARDGADVNVASKFAYGRDFAKLNGEALARAAVDEALRGLGGAPVPSGEYEVALSCEAASDLLQTFASSFSADAAQKGLSLLKGREGEAIASACVTLVDDPLRAGGFSGAPFDGEGVAAYTKPIIERGVLMTLLHNLKTAAKAGVQTTGNAARSSYAAQVSIAPTNFFIEPGAMDRSALLETMGDGLLITELQGLHSGANAVSGVFSLSAKGYVVEGGRIGRPVSGITVAGNFFDLLKQVRAVGSDLWFGFPGVSCVGSPTLLAGALKVAGN